MVERGGEHACPWGAAGTRNVSQHPRDAGMKEAANEAASDRAVRLFD